MPITKDGLVCELYGACGKNSPPSTYIPDLSGNGNNSTLVGFNYTTASGFVSPKLVLDGLDDYLNCGNNASLNLTTAGSLEIWVKSNIAQSDGRFMLFSKAKGVSYNGANICFNLYWFSDKTIRGTISDGVNSYVVTTTYAYDLTVLKHIVFEWDSTGLYLYIDGVGRASLLTSNKYAQSAQSTPLLNGYYGYGNSGVRYLNGEVYAVRIYNRALNSLEVSANYAVGATYIPKNTTTNISSKSLRVSSISSRIISNIRRLCTSITKIASTVSSRRGLATRASVSTSSPSFSVSDRIVSCFKALSSYASSATSKVSVLRSVFKSLKSTTDFIVSVVTRKGEADRSIPNIFAIKSESFIKNIKFPSIVGKLTLIRNKSKTSTIRNKTKTSIKK